MNRKTLGILATTALVFLASAASAEITFDQNSAEEYCKNDWTKRGVLDKNMYSYCMDGQTDGFELAKERYLKYKLENHVELIDEIAQYAVTKWATKGHKKYQFNMVAAEIERQAEAFLDLQYDISVGAVKDGALTECKSKWLKRDEPNWNMVMYCLKDK
jgi:hypothetical protein